MIFILLIARNYYEKKEVFFIECMIIQLIILITYKINIGEYGVIIGILLIGYKARRLRLGNQEGDRRY